MARLSETVRPPLRRMQNRHQISQYPRLQTERSAVRWLSEADHGDDGAGVACPADIVEPDAAGAVDRIKRVGLAVDEDWIVPIDAGGAADGIGRGGDRIAKVKAPISHVASRIVGCEAKVADFIARVPVGRECLAFANQGNGSTDFGAGGELVYECGLNVVFAAGTIRIKRNLIIESAPLAQIDRLAERGVKYVHDGSVVRL